MKVRNSSLSPTVVRVVKPPSHGLLQGLPLCRSSQLLPRARCQSLAFICSVALLPSSIALLLPSVVLKHYRLRLVVVLEVPNPPIVASSSSSASSTTGSRRPLCSSSSLRLRRTPAPLLRLLRSQNKGMFPIKVTMQIMKSCYLLLQEHSPNHLGGLFVIRLPRVLKVTAQSFIQALFLTGLACHVVDRPEPDLQPAIGFFQSIKSGLLFSLAWPKAY
ncbi:hypothetical protein Ahy_B06g083664 [Arachis hypogaea]|uniref:Uncharacterized protein n=1 Tax=Arachis hypogaea TaxID=3818 RepID=A0A444YQ61_ARAHY|nr:hypothetical protein Ahy_B06g083664 [Arachis hypogaea]